MQFRPVPFLAGALVVVAVWAVRHAMLSHPSHADDLSPTVLHERAATNPDGGSDPAADVSTEDLAYLNQLLDDSQQDGLVRQRHQYRPEGGYRDLTKDRERHALQRWPKESGLRKTSLRCVTRSPETWEIFSPALILNFVTFF